MNRFEKQGITQELIKGRKIIICGSHTYTSHIFHEIQSELEANEVTPVKVLRARGRELIQVGNGQLSFARSPDALRGQQADVVLFSALFRGREDFHETWLTNARLVTQQSTSQYLDVISG